MKKFFTICMILLVVFSMSSCFVARDAASAVRGISSQTLNADHIIFNYESYFNKYNDVKSKVRMYNQETEDMKVLTGSALDDARMRHSGTFNYMQDVCSEYNSNSQKLNRNLFKDRSLPYMINVDVQDGRAILREEM